MKREIEEFFSVNKIEYFAALDYSLLRETSPHIMQRAGFAPRSAIVYLIPYYVSRPKNISIYASSLDYHIFIREFSLSFVEHLKKLYPDNNFIGYGDHSPIDERHAALLGGLGILGDNGLLINEKYGSYVFLADVVTDISPQELGTVSCEIKRCRHCGACTHACPTAILRGEGDVCLSEITQRKGELSEKEIELMRKFDTVWGCDLCQSSCPHNLSPEITPIEFFHRDRIELLTSELLTSMSTSEFKMRAFGWRPRYVVERNLKALHY